MKTVFLVNRSKCSNLGDQAINESFKRFIKSHFDVKIFEYDYTSKEKSAKPLRLEYSKNVQTVKLALKKVLPLDLIWAIRNILRIYKSLRNLKPDLVIIGGGQLLLPGRFSVAAFLWVYLAKKLNIKVIFSNIGIGDQFQWRYLKLISYAIRNCDGLNVRDEKSAVYIKKFVPDCVDVTVSADIVFTDAYETNYSSSREPKNSLLLLGVTDLSVYNEYNRPVSRQEYHDIWISFVENLNFRLCDALLIYTTSEDYSESLKFRDYVKHKMGISIDVAEYDRLEEFKHLLRQGAIVVSGRMHALILALNCGCLIHVFPISQKLITFIAQTKKSGHSHHIQNSYEKTKRFLSMYLG